MVGPSTTEEGRLTAVRRLKIGFVCLVAGSGSLVAAASGASPRAVALAGAGAGVVGVALLVYLVRIGREWERR